MSVNTEETHSVAVYEPLLTRQENENKRLLEGASEGDRQKVQEALDNGANKNVKQQPAEETALHLAARHAHAPVVKILLDRGADLEARNKSRWTPLILASKGGSKQVVELLLARSKDLAEDFQNFSRQTTSTNSPKTQGSSTVQIPPQILPQIRSYINLSSRNGTTALTMACHAPNAEIVPLLLVNQADVDAQDDDGDTALILAAHYGNAKMVEDILSFKPDIHKTRYNGRSALHEAIRNDNEDERERIVDLLLKNGLSANLKDADGSTPLHMASDHGYAGIVQKLLSKPGFDVNVQNEHDETPIHLASENGHLDVVGQLLDCSTIRPNLQTTQDETPLFLAVRENHTEVVRKLLSHTDIDGNLPNNYADTPLHIACEEGYSDIVDGLLSWCGIKLNVTDERDKTPLHVAIINSHWEVVRKLLNHSKIDIDVMDFRGWTPLHSASAVGGLEIVEIILDKTKGERIDARDDMGQTALLIACRNGYVGIAKLLFSRGAKSRVGSDLDQSAWFLLVKYFFKTGLPPQELLGDLKAGSTSEGTTSETTSADIELILKHVDKEEKASATILAETDEDRSFLARLMGIELSQLVDYELIRLAKSPALSDTAQIVGISEDKDAKFEPRPTSALQWAAYHGRHDIVWWLLKNSNLGRESETDEEVAKGIAERRRNQLTQAIQVPEGKGASKRISLGATRDRDIEREEKGFKLTVDMLTDPPVVEGAHFESFRKPITSDTPQEILKAYWATIVDFYERDGRVDLLRRSESVSNVIYAKGKLTNEDMGPEGIMNKARTDLGRISIEAAKEKKYEKKDLRMRWIHLPANNMEWMEDLAKRIFTDKQVPASEWVSLNNLLQRSWHELPTDTAPARFMKPVCLKEPSQNLRSIAENEELHRAIRQFNVKENRRKSVTEENKQFNGRRSAESHKKYRAEDPAIGCKAVGDSDPKVGSPRAQQTATYERVALYMPYLTFGLCLRKPPAAVGKDNGASGDDDHPHEKGHKPLRKADKSPRKGGQALEEDGEDKQKNSKDSNEDDEALKRYNDLLEASQRYNDLLKSYENKTIHGTRSLDRFFYNSLPDMDMDDRDQNQVFTRSFFRTRNGDGVSKDRKMWPYLAVDQLWLWVIDEETIITSSTHRKDNFHDPIVKRLFIELRKAKMKKNGQPPPSSVKDMSRFIVTFCVDFLHSLKWEDFSPMRQPQMRSSSKDTVSSMSVQLLYEERINLAASKEKELFHDFKMKMNKTKSIFQKSKRETQPRNAGHRVELDHEVGDNLSEIEHTHGNRNWASISGAADLLDEVKDILDELTILKTLVTRQVDVWKDLVGDDSESKSARGPAYTLRGVQEMIEMADRIQESVNDILNLEQNGINIDQAQESARQGTILMAFTIVTVVFTPLSFLTSLFALNVTSFQHNSSGDIEYEPGWLFPIMFCCSATIIILMIYAFKGQKVMRGSSKTWGQSKGDDRRTHREDNGWRTVYTSRLRRRHPRDSSAV